MTKLVKDQVIIATCPSCGYQRRVKDMDDEDCPACSEGREYTISSKKLTKNMCTCTHEETVHINGKCEWPGCECPEFRLSK